MSLSVPKFAKNPVCRTDALIDDLVHPGHGNLDLIDYVLEMATRPEPNEGPTEQALSMRALVDSLSAVASCLRNIGLWQMVAMRLEIPGAATRPNATTADFALNRQWVIDWCHKIRTVGSATSEALTALELQSTVGDVAAAWLLKRGADAREVLPRACYYGREDGFDAMVQALGGTANVDAIARNSAVIMAFERGNETMARVAIDALAPVDPMTVMESIQKAGMRASTPLLQLLVPLTPNGVDAAFMQKALAGAVLSGGGPGGPVAAIATVVAFGGQPLDTDVLVETGLRAIGANRPLALRALDNINNGFPAFVSLLLCIWAAFDASNRVHRRYPVPQAPPLEYMQQKMECIKVLVSTRNVVDKNEMLSNALQNIGLHNNPFLMLHFLEMAAALPTLVPLVYTNLSRSKAMCNLFSLYDVDANFLDAIYRCAREFLYPAGGKRLEQMYIDIVLLEKITQFIVNGLVWDADNPHRARIFPDAPTLLRLINTLYSRDNVDEPLVPELSDQTYLRMLWHLLNRPLRLAPLWPSHVLDKQRVRVYRDLFPPPDPPNESLLPPHSPA